MSTWKLGCLRHWDVSLVSKPMSCSCCCACCCCCSCRNVDVFFVCCCDGFRNEIVCVVFGKNHQFQFSILNFWIEIHNIIQLNFMCQIIVFEIEIQIVFYQTKFNHLWIGNFYFKGKSFSTVLTKYVTISYIHTHRIYYNPTKL